MTPPDELTPETLMSAANETLPVGYTVPAWETLRILRDEIKLHVPAWEADRARIEALEKAATLVYDYERPTGNTEGTNWAILGAALAKEEKP